MANCAQIVPPRSSQTYLCPLMSDWSQIPPSEILKNKMLLPASGVAALQALCTTQSHGTTQWDFQNKEKSGWTGAGFFVSEVPLCNLHPNMADLYFQTGLLCKGPKAYNMNVQSQLFSASYITKTILRTEQSMYMCTKQ